MVRDLICLRAGVDDDKQNQPDFEMERASWDEYETSTLSRTMDHRIEVWTDGSVRGLFIATGQYSSLCVSAVVF